MCITVGLFINAKTKLNIYWTTTSDDFGLSLIFVLKIITLKEKQFC